MIIIRNKKKIFKFARLSYKMQLTSRLDRISSTLFGLTAPLTPRVTILTGGDTTRRDGETGCSDGDEGAELSFKDFILLFFFFRISSNLLFSCIVYTLI